MELRSTEMWKRISSYTIFKAIVAKRHFAFKKVSSFAPIFPMCCSFMVQISHLKSEFSTWWISITVTVHLITNCQLFFQFINKTKHQRIWPQIHHPQIHLFANLEPFVAHALPQCLQYPGTTSWIAGDYTHLQIYPSTPPVTEESEKPERKFQNKKKTHLKYLTFKLFPALFKHYLPWIFFDDFWWFRHPKFLLMFIYRLVVFSGKKTSQRRQPSVRGGIFCEPLKMLVSSKARRAK